MDFKNAMCVKKINIIETLRQLVDTFGVSSCESAIAAQIKRFAEPYADEILSDPLGNLLVHKKGSGKRMMFSAHMDTVGIMVTGITEEGYLNFTQIGGLVASDLSRQSVIFENGVQGVIGVPEEKEEKSFALQDLYLDIGAKDAAEAKQQVRIGDCARFATTFFSTGDRIFSNYLDNRAGCLVLLDALSRVQGENDLWFVFSVQEEVGIRGAKTAACTIQPDWGISVDVTCTNDLPGAQDTCSCKLGDGVAIKVMDHSILCSAQVIAKLEQLAQEHGIPNQRDVMAFGGTDGAAIQTVGSGVITGGISVPCRYTHAPVECIDRKDLTACVDLLVALAESE